MISSTFQFTHNNTVMTAIPLGPDSVSLPRGMFQGGKVPGYLVTGSTVEPWFWDGIKSIHGTLCIYSRTGNLKPLSLLFDRHIPAASRLELFLLLLRGLETIRKGAQDPWFITSFPLNAVWIIPGSGILLLPQPMSNVMMNSVSEKERDSLLGVWKHPKVPGEQTWMCQMTALLYALLGNIPPFENEHVREAGYDPLPLWTLNPSVNDSFSSKLMNWLTLNEPLPDAETLESCIRTHKSSLIASASSLRQKEAEKVKEEHTVSIRKRAKRKVFLRKRGFALITAAILIFIAAAGITNRVIEASRPPATAGMNPIELITYFYQLQDELNMGEFGDILTRSAKNARESQMIYLHVTNAMRSAYGGGNFLPAGKWVEDGKPPLSPDTLVYGITDLHIFEIGDLKYRTEFILWLPAGSEVEESEELHHALAEGIRYIEVLQLTDRETHYMIDSIEIIGQEPMKQEEETDQGAPTLPPAGSERM